MLMLMLLLLLLRTKILRDRVNLAALQAQKQEIFLQKEQDDRAKKVGESLQPELQVAVPEPPPRCSSMMTRRSSRVGSCKMGTRHGAPMVAQSKSWHQSWGIGAKPNFYCEAIEAGVWRLSYRLCPRRVGGPTAEESRRSKNGLHKSTNQFVNQSCIFSAEMQNATIFTQPDARKLIFLQNVC